MTWKEDHYVPMKKKCPYKGNCKSYPGMCGTCKNNPDNEDHYYPKRWHPWIEPYNPWSVMARERRKGN